MLYILIHLSFLPKLPKLVASFSKSRGFCSLVLGAGWLFSSHRFAFSSMAIGMWVVTVIAFLMFSLTAYCVLFWLEESFVNVSQPKWYRALVYGAIPAAVWGVYFLVWAPGIMTYDSFWQWDMAHHLMPYNAWHPVMHTWLIQGVTSVWNSPASYTLFQIVLVSAIIGYALYELQKAGVPFRWVIATDLFYTLNPVNGFYVLTMWKDIPFSAFLLLLTVFFSKIVLTKGAWLKKLSNMVMVIVVSFMTMTLRDNGSMVVLASLILFFIIAKGARSRLAMVTLSVLVIYAIFTGPVISAFHVIRNPLNQALAIPSQQIAAVYKNNGQFTPQLRTYFNKILPAEKWKTDYNPYTVNPIKHDPSYDAIKIKTSFSAYLKNWAKLLVLNPKIFVRAYLQQVSSIWQFQTPRGMSPYFTSGVALQNYPDGIKLNAPTKDWKKPNKVMMRSAYQHYKQQTQKASPTLPVMAYQAYKKKAEQTLRILKSKSFLRPFKPVFLAIFYGVDHKLENYFVKGALPLFVLLLGVFATVRNKGFLGLGIFLPVMFVIVTIAMAMPAPDFRYSYSFALCAPYLMWFGKIFGKS